MQSLQTTSTKKARRKFWFLPRFSLRTFLIVVVLLGAVLAPLVHRTREQIRVCDAIDAEPDGNLSYTLGDPPKWLQFLPQSWLNAGGGHWCCNVDSVSLRYLASISPIPEEQSRALCKRLLSLASEFPRLQDLEIDLESMPGDQDELTDMLSPLANMRVLDGLQINVENPSPWILQALPRMPSLTWLALNQFSHDEFAISLKELLKCPNLEWVEFPNPTLDGHDLSPLAQLTHLEFLGAENLVVTAAQMQCLKGHPALQDFKIASDAFTDEMLEILASLPQLESLDARDSLISDRGLSALGNAAKLQTLTLSEATITDEGFVKLCNCKALRSITCMNCKLTDAIGPALAGLPNLKALELGGTLTTAKLLDHLSSNKKLNRSVWSTSLGDSRISLEQLLKFFKLETRPQTNSYSENRHNSRLDAMYHFSNPPSPYHNGDEVYLSGIQGIHERLEHLGNPNGISSISLRSTDIDDSDLQQLSPRLNHPAIDISYTKCTANGVRYLIGNVTPTALTIGPMDDSDQAIKALSISQSLKHLTLCGKWTLSDEDRTALLGMASLESLTMRDSQIDKSFAEELCLLPQLWSIETQNLILRHSEICAIRMKFFRTKYGIPGGVTALLAACPTQGDFKLVDEAELDPLIGHSVWRLSVVGMKLSPAAIDKIAQMNSLVELNLSNTGLGDNQFAKLKTLTNLMEINLNGNPISDAAIATISPMPQLSNIQLANTQITDQGLTQIMTMALGWDIGSEAAVAEKAWANIAPSSKLSIDSMDFFDVASLSNILATVPVNLMPSAIGNHLSEFEITADDIALMRRQNQESAHGRLVFAQETLSIWPPDKILVGKDRRIELAIIGSGCVGRVLKLANPHYVSNIEIVSDQLNAQEPLEFPNTVRNVSLRKCTVSTQTIQALAKCKWLRAIEFDSCDLTDCSLELLLTMPMLCELKIERTALSREQQSVLDRLRPTLIEPKSAGGGGLGGAI